jgi:hypothetical protein
MLTEEQCSELERKSRNCRDNAIAEKIVSEAFEHEYGKGLSSHPLSSKETYHRTTELYDFVIGGNHRAQNFLRDAELFEAAAASGRALLKKLKEGHF